MLFRSIPAAALAVLLPVTMAGAARAATFATDPNHCTSQFAVRHMMLSAVRGTILCSEGTIAIQGDSAFPAAVKVTLNLKTLDTKNEKRDKSLLNDYFEAEKYPTMTFESSKIVPGSGQKFQMTGKLTLHGVTKEVTLQAEALGSIVDARGRKHVGYSAETHIDRRDFGMTLAEPIPGGILAGYDVDITVAAEAIEQK